jgi:hypothetical protein
MFDPSRHHALKDIQWVPELVRKTIQDIAHDAIDQILQNRKLPRHPMDEYGVCSDLYMGMAGVIWALKYLGGEQLIETDLDFAALLEERLSAAANS